MTVNAKRSDEVRSDMGNGCFEDRRTGAGQL